MTSFFFKRISEYIGYSCRLIIESLKGRKFESQHVKLGGWLFTFICWYLNFIVQCDQIGRFLHFGQLFKACGNNYIAQIFDILRQVSKSFIFLLDLFLGNFIDIWGLFTSHSIHVWLLGLMLPGLLIPVPSVIALDIHPTPRRVTCRWRHLRHSVHRGDRVLRHFMTMTWPNRTSTQIPIQKVSVYPRCEGNTMPECLYLCHSCLNMLGPIL